MAQKKSTPRNTNTRKKTNTKRTYNKKNTKINNDIKYEVIVIAFVAVSLLMIISVYFNGGGVVGEFVRNVFFGLFGIGAYILPIFVFGSSVLKIFNKSNQRLNNKIMLLFLLIVALSTFGHVVYIHGSQIHKEISGQSAFFPILEHYFSMGAKVKLTGGFVGGLIGDLFSVLLGKLGSYLVLSLIIISLIILITEKSLFSLLTCIGKILKEFTMKIYNEINEIISSKRLEKAKQTSQTRHQDKDFMQQVERQEEIKIEKEKAKDYFLNKVTLEEEQENKVVNVTPETTVGEMIDAKETKNEENMQISFFKEEKKNNKPKQSDVEFIDSAVEKNTPNKGLYEYPPLELLKDNPFSGVRGSEELVKKNAKKLQRTLESFGVGARVVNVSYGPTITRYELQPDIGVKVSKIVNLSDDIALNLAASGIRIEAPIPGKSLIGIEVPNKDVQSVYIKEVVDTEAFKNFPSKIAFALGKDISGETIIADIARMPHMLISGATGSGKSVCVNTLITSILFRAHPDEVKLLMIDPKVVELKVYNGIPHLLIPVVTDPKKAAGALYWAVQEMSERYQLFASTNVRDLNGYNQLVQESGEMKKLPQIVIIVDELADLMQVAAKDVEEAICRLAQMARAAGIHLVIATQRPSVDVITGVIKANIPSRIAFSVSSGTDSRTIIDMNGAEKLVGKGDMLYYPVGIPKPIRVQGAFISDKEVENVVEFLKAGQKVDYNNSIMEQLSKDNKEDNKGQNNTVDNENDAYFDEALELVIEKQKASASMIQRRFRVGYNRAARIIDQLHDAGFVGGEEGSKPRKVFLTQEEFYRLKHEANQVNSSNEVVVTSEDNNVE